MSDTVTTETETETEPTPVPETPPAPEAARSTVQVPVWALAVLVGLVLLLGAFFVGRATAPSGDSGPKTLADAVEMTASGQMEVGQFDARTLLQALSQNEGLDGLLRNLLEGQAGRR